MAKAQGKKAVGGSRKPAKPVARVKGKGPAKAKPAGKKSAPVRAAKKALAKPVRKVVAKAKKAAKSVGKATKKVATRAAKSVKPVKTLMKAKKASPKALKVKEIKAVKPAKATPPKAAPKNARPPAVKAAKAARPVVKPAPQNPAPRPVPVAPAAKPAEPEKKRGRRARPRVHSDGVPVAAWLSTEKPRPASFIPAPPRAEAPAAIAAPPASSDRLLRPDDVDHPAVRTVPVRIDVEQGAGRFYVIANPNEVSVRATEGIEWDFRYLGGADVAVEEIVVEFPKPSPFNQTVFKTRKPGGARPHRQLSGSALPSAVGKRIEYVVRAMTPFKTELASTKIWVNVTS